MRLNEFRNKFPDYDHLPDEEVTETFEIELGEDIDVSQ
jgi:hypothetical protein